MLTRRDNQSLLVEYSLRDSRLLPEVLRRLYSRSACLAGKLRGRLAVVSPVYEALRRLKSPVDYNPGVPIETVSGARTVYLRVLGSPRALANILFVSPWGSPGSPGDRREIPPARSRETLGKQHVLLLRFRPSIKASFLPPTFLSLSLSSLQKVSRAPRCSFSASSPASPPFPLPLLPLCPPCPFLIIVALMARPPSSPPQAEPPAAPTAAPSPARGTPPAPAPPPSAPSVPSMPFIDTGSRARMHARDVLSRIHADAVVFAQPCARCVSRGETCWGQASGVVSKKCGPCVYGGKPCGVARDQVSRTSRSCDLIVLTSIQTIARSSRRNSRVLVGKSPVSCLWCRRPFLWCRRPCLWCRRLSPRCRRRFVSRTRPDVQRCRPFLWCRRRFVSRPRPIIRRRCPFLSRRAVISRRCLVVSRRCAVWLAAKARLHVRGAGPLLHQRAGRGVS